MSWSKAMGVSVHLLRILDGRGGPLTPGLGDSGNLLEVSYGLCI